MGWESSSVVGFDLGPLLEGQMRTAKLKSAYILAYYRSYWFWSIVFMVDTICISFPMR